MATITRIRWGAKLRPQLIEIAQLFLWSLSALLLVISVVFKDGFAFALFLVLVAWERSR